VDYLASELPRLHPNLFFQTPRSEFDRVVQDVRASVPSASDTDVVVGLMRIAATPGDPHTSVFTSEEFPKLGVRLRRLTSGLFVTSAEPALAAALGSKVVAFDGASAEAAEAAVARIVSHDNTAWLRTQLPLYLILPEVLHSLGLTAEASGLTLLLEDARGARFSLRAPGSRSATSLLDVTATSGAPLPLYRQRTSENYWSTLLPESRTLYLQYNRCQQGPEPFDAFARRLFQQLDQGLADRLVVDVRFNTGGDSSVDDPLIDGLRGRSSWRARGRLFAIIGGPTFSSGLFAADDLWKLGAILAGEPTGGKPNHYGNVRTFNLSNSGLRVGYSTQFYRLASQGDPASLFPEIAVEPTIADLAAGRDPVLEAVLRVSALSTSAGRRSGR
jgi:hypothetical protein